MTPPCYGCDKRHVGCHGGCAEYAAYKSARADILAKKYTENDALNILFARLARCTKRIGQK